MPWDRLAGIFKRCVAVHEGVIAVSAPWDRLASVALGPLEPGVSPASLFEPIIRAVLDFALESLRL